MFYYAVFNDETCVVSVSGRYFLISPNDDDFLISELFLNPSADNIVCSCKSIDDGIDYLRSYQNDLN